MRVWRAQSSVPQRRPPPSERGQQNHEEKNRRTANTQYRDAEKHVPSRRGSGHGAGSRLTGMNRAERLGGFIRIPPPIIRE